MLPSTFTKKEDLRFFETTVETQGLRLDCKLICHLTIFDKQSSALENRTYLRKQLVHIIEQKYKKNFSLEQKKKLLTPGMPPQLPFVSVSISHCAFMGGFVTCRSDFLDTPLPILKSASTNKRASIGFDLEELRRAKEKTVLRVSNQTELNHAPSPSALWSAKEAAYKSIGSLQNNIYIKHISIFDWQCVPPIRDTQAQPNINKKPEKEEKELPKIYDYKFTIKEKNIKGKGIICQFKSMVIGLAVFKVNQNFFRADYHPLPV